VAVDALNPPWVTFALEHARRLAALCPRLRALRDDIDSAALEACWQVSRAGVPDGCSVRAYLRGAIRRRFADVCRRRLGQAARPRPGEVPLDDVPGLPAPGPAPGGELEAEELWRRLTAGLPLRVRVLLRLVYREGFGIPEAGRAVGYRSTAGWHGTYAVLARARERMRARLARGG
jgi:DNA-directed RNA polymerase specialized sigma24 family protein